jgi:hypothetical protein
MRHGQVQAVTAVHRGLTYFKFRFLQRPQVALTLDQGANDNDAHQVGAVLWVLWCLMLSMGALGMAYLSWAA